MAPSHLQYFTARFAMAPSHQQYFTARCAMAPSHLQYFTARFAMAPSHQQYFTARCAMAPSHLQYFTCRFAMAPSHLQYFTARCAMAPSHLQYFTARCAMAPSHLQYFTARFAMAPSHLENVFYRRIWDSTFSPAIFYLQMCDGTCNILPPDVRWHLLTLKFFSCRFGINAPKNKNDQAKIQIQTEIMETTMKSASAQTKISHSIQNIQTLLKTKKLCENHQKKIRNALQPNCTTINAIIVTNTTKYGSIHRSCTLHHKPSCKNTERSQKTTKGHHGMTSISTKSLLENKEVTKNKMINRIPKMEAKHRSPQCHWLPATGFREFKIWIPMHFTMRPTCSKPKPSTKREVKFTKSTHMINGVLLLRLQCPNA